MSDKPKVLLNVKPEILVKARCDAGARGVISLLASLNLSKQEQAMALVQVVGATIADQVPDYPTFHAVLQSWAKGLANYAEANKVELEKLIALNSFNQRKKS